MISTTVVYITSNRENPVLEERIKAKLLQTMGSLPLVSVSQKPIDFGTNICVGDLGASDQNAWRQLQIGAQVATTDFISPAESDFIYPPEYFTFSPERPDTFYRASPIWVLFMQRAKAKLFYRKGHGTELAIMVGRQTLLNRIDAILGPTAPYIFDRPAKHAPMALPIPIVTFKTDSSMHRRTPMDRRSACRQLPGIGTAADLIQEYLQ